MRKAYKLVQVPHGQIARTHVDNTVPEFIESMGYGRIRYQTKDDYIARYSGSWFHELRQALKEVLRKDRMILSVGSGECEYDIPFFLEGYNIVGSDIASEALEQVKNLFPQFRTMVLDIFHPQITEPVDDILITGLDFYFPEEEVRSIMRNAKILLKPGGRLLFVLRYRDNWLTRLIDYIGIPLLGIAHNCREWVRGSKIRYKLKCHGYRRTPREIVALATEAGFSLQRVIHAGTAMELNRLYIHQFPRLFALFRRLDSRLHVLNSGILFEFVTYPVSLN